MFKLLNIAIALLLLGKSTAHVGYWAVIAAVAGAALGVNVVMFAAEKFAPKA